MFTVLGGIGAVLLLVGIVFVGLILAVVGIAFVVKKSKDKGVVFKDGISNEEAKMVLESINEVIAADKTREVLQKYADAAQRALKATKQPPVL